jgi:hypothetical protein
VACFVRRRTGFAGRKTHLGHKQEGFVQPRDVIQETGTDPVQSRTPSARSEMCLGATVSVGRAPDRRDPYRLEGAIDFRACPVPFDALADQAQTALTHRTREHPDGQPDATRPATGVLPVGTGIPDLRTGVTPSERSFRDWMTDLSKSETHAFNPDKSPKQFMIRVPGWLTYASRRLSCVTEPTTRLSVSARTAIESG